VFKDISFGVNGTIPIDFRGGGSGIVDQFDRGQFITR